MDHQAVQRMLRTHPAAAETGADIAASSRFAPASGAAPLRLTAVRAPVLQRKEDPTGLPPELRQSAQEVPAQPADAPKEASKPQKRGKCDDGLAKRWGKDTTCSRYGPAVGTREPAKGEKGKSVDCCNHWPYSVEAWARGKGWNGAASCKSHLKQVATVSWKDKEVQVLCTDSFQDADHLIELSPKAMVDLTGGLENHKVKVCYSGTKEAGLCEWNGRMPSHPEVEDCLTKGCPVPEGTPKLKDVDWPRN